MPQKCPFSVTAAPGMNNLNEIYSDWFDSRNRTLAECSGKTTLLWCNPRLT
jgi:hypothetical protein